MAAIVPPRFGWRFECKLKTRNSNNNHNDNNKNNNKNHNKTSPPPKENNQTKKKKERMITRRKERKKERKKERTNEKKEGKCSIKNNQAVFWLHQSVKCRRNPSHNSTANLITPTQKSKSLPSDKLSAFQRVVTIANRVDLLFLRYFVLLESFFRWREEGKEGRREGGKEGRKWGFAAGNQRISLPHL